MYSSVSSVCLKSHAAGTPLAHKGWRLQWKSTALHPQETVRVVGGCPLLCVCGERRGAGGARCQRLATVWGNKLLVQAWMWVEATPCALGALLPVWV